MICKLSVLSAWHAQHCYSNTQFSNRQHINYVLPILNMYIIIALYIPQFSCTKKQYGEVIVSILCKFWCMLQTCSKCYQFCTLLDTNTFSWTLKAEAGKAQTQRRNKIHRSSQLRMFILCSFVSLAVRFWYRQQDIWMLFEVICIWLLYGMLFGIFHLNTTGTYFSFKFCSLLVNAKSGTNFIMCKEFHFASKVL